MKFARTALLSLGMVTFLLAALGGLPLTGQAAPPTGDAAADRPQRAIDIYTEFTGLVTEQNASLKVEAHVVNKGRVGEDVDIIPTIVPEGWEIRIESYGARVMGLHVPPNDEKSVSLMVHQPDEAPPGVYEFEVAGRTLDGALEAKRSFRVEVFSKAKEEGGSLEISTHYPQLSGPTDTQFEFSVRVFNRTQQDHVLALKAEGPTGWDVSFKPAYEDKLISSLSIKRKDNQTMGIKVKPAWNAKPGKYPVHVEVGTEDGKYTADLKLSVDLTGTLKIDVGTATGLLSLDAEPGKTSKLSFFVKNSGSAVNHQISFLSLKPENWEVEFSPPEIEAIDPNDVKQVEVSITPAENALVGDYSVGLSIKGEKSTKALDIRVTVKASTAWAWVGIAIIVLVIIGLGGMFRWLGRR